MQALRYVLRNVNVINIILALMLLFLIVTMGSSDEDIRIKPPEVNKPVAQEAAPAAKTEENQNPFPTDYSVIAEQNLFHPDRKIPVETVAAAPLPVPDFVLYGTLISDDLRVAYMEDKKSPQSTPGRPNRQSPLHQGESLSGYIVKEIDKDKVTMVRGDESLVVNLEDAKSKARNLPQAQAQAPAPAQIPGAPVQPQARQAPTLRKNAIRSSNQSQPQQPFVPVESRTRPNATRPSSPAERRSGGGFINLFRR